MSETWYEYLFGKEEIIPDEKIVYQRHLLMKQIKLSNLKLNPVKPKLKKRVVRFPPVSILKKR